MWPCSRLEVILITVNVIYLCYPSLLFYANSWPCTCVVYRKVLGGRHGDEQSVGTVYRNQDFGYAPAQPTSSDPRFCQESGFGMRWLAEKLRD